MAPSEESRRCRTWKRWDSTSPREKQRLRTGLRRQIALHRLAAQKIREFQLAEPDRPSLPATRKAKERLLQIARRARGLRPASSRVRTTTHPAPRSEIRAAFPCNSRRATRQFSDSPETQRLP